MQDRPQTAAFTQRNETVEKRLSITAVLLASFGCNYDPRPVPLLQRNEDFHRVDAGRSGVWVEPAGIVDCGGAEATSGVVSWNFGKRAGIGAVRIDLRAPESAQATVFAQGQAKGSAQTGPWLRPGLRFLAVDMRTGRTLAGTEVSRYSCG